MANDTTTPGEHPELGARFPEREFYLMMYLLMGLGLRRHEILSLRAGSIDVERGILTVPSPNVLACQEVAPGLRARV